MNAFDAMNVGKKGERRQVAIGRQQTRSETPVRKMEDALPPEQWTNPQLIDQINARLQQLLPSKDVTPGSLWDAMSYSLLSPGKRLRPLLTILTSMHFGCRDLVALDAACAIEMMHAASLILDDLPAMDNALMRRGKPTAHRQFGEDIAILAGVGLLNHAFGILTTYPGLSADTRVELLRLATTAVGTEGLIGGQVLDLKLRDNPADDDVIGKINGLKTAALFGAATEAGAVIAGVRGHMLKTVQEFALALGSAFQIADDLLDDPAFQGRTGKDTGKDLNKPTILSILGKDDARKLLHSHLEAARQCLDRTDSADNRLASILDRGFAQFIN